MRNCWKMAVFLGCFVWLSGLLYGDTAYFRELVNKGNATYYDACRVISILRTGHDDAAATFEQLRSALLKAGIIPAELEEKKSDDFLNRDELAYMLFKVLKMKGGLTIRLFGLSERDAFRECVDKKLMAGGYPNQTLSGEELINILTEAEKYQEANTPAQPEKKAEQAPPENKQAESKEGDK